MVTCVVDLNRYCLPYYAAPEDDTTPTTDDEMSEEVADESASLILEKMLNDKLSQYLGDLYTAWWVILLAAGFALVISFIYMFIVRCCAGVITWCCIFLFIGVLAAAGYFFYLRGTDDTYEYLYIHYFYFNSNIGMIQMHRIIANTQHTSSGDLMQFLSSLFCACTRESNSQLP
jgi:hypothetical protein